MKLAEKRGEERSEKLGIQETFTKAIAAFLNTTDLTFKAIAENLGVSLAQVEVVAKNIKREN